MKTITLTDAQAAIFAAMWDHATENFDSMHSVAEEHARHLNPDASDEQIDVIVVDTYNACNTLHNVAAGAIKAVVILYDGKMWEDNMVEVDRWYCRTPKEAIALVEVAMKARGVPEEDIAWGETQIGYQARIGYQVSDGRTDNPTYMYEICGWEDEGIAELGDEGEEYDGDA